MQILDSNYHIMQNNINSESRCLFDYVWFFMALCNIFTFKLCDSQSFALK